MSRSDLVDIACRVVRETERALLLDFGGEENVWVPKQYAELDKDAGTVAMPEWLASEKGLI